MSKKALNLSAIVLATMLTGCSSFMSGIGQFGSLNDGHPILINRPVVVTPVGTKLCRSSEAVLAILPNPQKGCLRKDMVNR